MPSKIKHIIWDWNGTLINDAWLFVELMNEELKKRSLPLINIKKYRQEFTFPVKKYYENLGFNFKKEDFKKVGYHFIQSFIKRRFEASLFKNSKKILHQINRLGISQTIISAQENQLLNETIIYYKIEHYFKAISGIAHYYADSKIEIATQQRTLINCKDNEILMVGDSMHDYEVATKLNLKCILFSGGHYEKNRLLKANCIIIDDVLDVMEYL